MSMQEKNTPEIAIIGAGVGGITLALELKRNGIHDFVIYERDKAVGGTWYNNRYPGCRCDVPVVQYSHSRYPYAGWKESHPPRSEILAYWTRLAETHDITPHIRFSHILDTTTWNTSTNAYDLNLTLPDGSKQKTSHRILVSAIGGFSKPLWPDIEGLDKFKGTVIHTSRWPEDLKVEDLRGKKVAIVGNACSGTQVVSALSKEPTIEITAIARSGQWLFKGPSRDGPHTIPYSERRQWLHSLPLVLWLVRLWTYCTLELIWFVIPQNSRIRDPIQKRMADWMIRRAPPELKDVIVPDFPLGSKRMIQDGGYLNALNLPNVTPVWDKVASATEHAVTVTSGESYNVDVLVLATGFDVAQGIDITGNGKQDMLSGRRDHTKCYHGVSVPGYPNFFMLLGSNVSPGHSSVVYQLEVQSNYITALIKGMRESKLEVLEVKQDACDKYNEWLKKRLLNTVWTRAKSYMRADGGTGDVYTHWPGPLALFWWHNMRPVWRDFVGGEKAAENQWAKDVKSATRVLWVVVLAIFGTRAVRG